MIILRKTIGARLECVRGSLTDTEFAELINDVALNELRDQQRIMKFGAGR